MGFFEDTIKKAHEVVEQDKKSELIVPIVQRAYIKVKSKYRGLKGKIFCVRFADEYTWYTSRRSLRRAMDKLAYTIGDYLILDDERAHRIMVRNVNKGAIQ
jgi:hypothetical protein